MYTNIPLDEGNQCALRALRQLTTSKQLVEIPNIPVLSDLLDMVTRNNVFEFDGEFYIQTRGVPMGNILAPSYSGLFMGELEQKLIKIDSDKIKLWVRYIDDIFVAWSGTNTEFETFLNKCNDAHPTMKFTGECSADTGSSGLTQMKQTSMNRPRNLNGRSWREDTTKKIIKPLIKKIHFKDRHRIIYRKKKEQTNPLPSTLFLSLTYNGHIPEVRQTLREIWDDVEKDPLLYNLFPEKPCIVLNTNRSLSKLLVRAKLKKTNSTPIPEAHPAATMYADIDYHQN